MKFEILGAIREVEIIAAGSAVRIRKSLWRKHGYGNWRKMKGIAEVMYPDGSIWEAELHWFEAHGIGRRMVKIKRELREL